ncbi:MAG: GDSL-type esterase/lipase family protein [Bacteroidota bacterium]
MRFLLQFSFMILACAFFSCKTEVTECEGEEAVFTDVTIEVLTLGDSRVEGGSPEFESYRYNFWKTLVENSWDIDFIGTRQDPGVYPLVQNRCFDIDHEGLGGETTVGLIETLKNKTFSKTPEVVLVGIGGNDLTEGGASAQATLNNLEEIIDLIQGLNPNTLILLEQIAPGTTEFMTTEFTDRFLAYNAGIPAIATAKTTADSKVIVVDMATGFNDGLLADPVHYNEAGAQFVAARYYAAFEANITR